MTRFTLFVPLRAFLSVSTSAETERAQMSTLNETACPSFAIGGETSAQFSTAGVSVEESVRHRPDVLARHLGTIHRRKHAVVKRVTNPVARIPVIPPSFRMTP